MIVRTYIAKLLKKKKYKAEVYIHDGNFTAEYYSDALNESLSWTLAGISESYVTSSNTKSLTRGIYGKISKFSLIHIADGKIKVCEYKLPSSSDYLFMTDAMVYVPDSIMNEVRRELPVPIQMLK